MPRLASLAATAALAVSLLIAAPAAAHWNETRWGMSVEQVTALYPAAREVASSVPGASRVFEIPSGLDWQGRRWTSVRFSFWPGQGLAVVILSADTTLAEMTGWVSARYGPATSTLDLGSARSDFFQDPGAGDTVWITSAPGASSLAVSWGPPREN